MSTDYNALCKDCHAYIILDRYHCWPWHGAGNHAMTSGDISQHADFLRTVRTVRLHKFMVRHRFHCLGVFDEHEIEYEVIDWQEIPSRWHEEMPWESEELSVQEMMNAYISGVDSTKIATYLQELKDDSASTS